MTYIKPIIDRSQTDMDEATAKSYLNVVDWMRIYGNALAAKELLFVLRGISVAFNQVAEPTIATIPTVTDLNLILGNIERIRIGANLPTISGLDPVFANWQPGSTADAPDFEDVNLWERVIQIVVDTMAPVMNYQVYCGIADVGQPYFWQNRFMQYSGFAPDLATPVRTAIAGISVCSDDLTGQNYFRNY